MHWYSFVMGVLATLAASGFGTLAIALLCLRKPEDTSGWWQGNPLSKREEDK
jgi:hypothetical protein